MTMSNRFTTGSTWDCECGRHTSKAMVAIDEAGFDWSFVTDEEVPTNMALMAFSESEFDLATYKRGLASVEEQLVFYKKNEPEFEGYRVKVNKSVCENFSNEIKKAYDAPIIEDWVSDCDEDEFEGTGQKEVRLVCNNAMRTNHQNFSKTRRNFSPIAVFTKSGVIPINVARQSSSRVASPVNTARPINTAAPKPFVNVAKPRPNAFQKSHSLNRRPFYQQPALINRNLYNKVNTAKGDPQVALKDTRIFNSGCPRHMTRNKSYLINYQDYDGGFVAFDGSSKGVKIIKCDNGTEFKNYEMNQFCGIKWIKREFSNARTPQQNGVAKRKNRTLIEAARTMLADSLLPIPFWAEAVNTACYVQNRVLVTKPHNKTPYELLIDRTPIISFMRPFGYPVAILNTLDHLGKFDGKANEGFLVGYSINNKDFRVFNSRTRKEKENLHVNFLENKPNVAARKEKVHDQEYILLPLLHTSSYVPSNSEEAEPSPNDDVGKKASEQPSCNEGVNAASSSFSHLDTLEDHSKKTNLEDTCIFDDAYDDRDEGA
ncbi:retrovirus-related pol polyprotein from transposon TNT 1-94 [Tanacetum coccineum]